MKKSKIPTFGRFVSFFSNHKRFFSITFSIYNSFRTNNLSLPLIWTKTRTAFWIKRMARARIWSPRSRSNANDPRHRRQSRSVVEPGRNCEEWRLFPQFDSCRVLATILGCWRVNNSAYHSWRILIFQYHHPMSTKHPKHPTTILILFLFFLIEPIEYSSTSPMYKLTILGWINSSKCL